MSDISQPYPIKLRRFSRTLASVPNKQRLMRLRYRYRGIREQGLYRPWGPVSKPRASTAMRRKLERQGFFRKKVQTMKGRWLDGGDEWVITFR